MQAVGFGFFSFDQNIQFRFTNNSTSSVASFDISGDEIAFFTGQV
jgi:hypothetical protein